MAFSRQVSEAARIDPELWRRVDRVFAGALERSAQARSEYLDRACAGDLEVRRQVDQLLAADRKASDTETWAEPSAKDTVGPGMLGPYRLLRVLGEGGMGTVYLGVRGDDQYHQLVTLKVTRSALNPDLLRRSRVERQILASLQHPYIARLLNGGTSEDGRPYMVMEYVQGESLDAYCVTWELTVEDRLRLFLKVCEAVSYAHRHLFVHRDLKPSNILIDREGHPRLLDFGIAKLLDPLWFPDADLETRTGRRPMTLRYASPEQVRGEPTATPTDVYSLGVLLFELLSGRCPYRVQGHEAKELEWMVREQRPVPPSRAASESGAPGSQELGRRLRGDLDAIVSKALEKDPEARYESVEAFATDIERHLSFQPVAARRGRWRYRLGRALRRHWAIASSLLALFAVVGIASAFLLLANQRVARERDKAAQALTLLVSTFKAADPLREDRAEVKVRELLDQGVVEVERSQGGEPEVLATVQEAIGQVYTHFGLFDRARPLLAQSLVLRRSALGGAPPGCGFEPFRAGRARVRAGKLPGGGREPLRSVGDSSLPVWPGRSRGRDEPGQFGQGKASLGRFDAGRGAAAASPAYSAARARPWASRGGLQPDPSGDPCSRSGRLRAGRGPASGSPPNSPARSLSVGR